MPGRAAHFSLRWIACGLVLAVSALSLVVACSDESSAAPTSGGDDAAVGVDGARDGGSADSGSKEAGPQTTCSLTKAYFEGCGNTDDLNCGSGFDTWCKANDETINSAAYRSAEALCLTDENCDGKQRRDCEYKHYNDETPTKAQKDLVAAYCETCEPADVSGCATRSTTYDPTKGIDSVGDIFVAAWELADPIVDEIKSSCTGPTVADPDAGTCAKTFSGCAGGIYIDRLPDCPK